MVVCFVDHASPTREPTCWAYMVGGAIGALVSTLFSAFLEPSSIILASALLGGALGVCGVFMAGTAGEAVVTTMMRALLATLGIVILPDTLATNLSVWGLPPLIGFSSGELFGGVVREFCSRRGG